jgi:hypothetical protein
MSFRPFADNLGNPNITYRYGTAQGVSAKIIEAAQREEAVDALHARMRAISGDPEGSDPEPYISPKDLETLTNFRALADHIHWAGAHEIGMHRSRFPARPGSEAPRGRVWNGSKWQPVKNELIKKIVLREAGETHHGYICGKLAIARPTQLVAFCDDGKLYSERGQGDLIASYGEGWGRLPESELMEPALASGHLYAVDTGAYLKPLKARLLEQIPEDVLATVNLQDFNLA